MRAEKSGKLVILKLLIEIGVNYVAFEISGYFRLHLYDTLSKTHTRLSLSKVNIRYLNILS